MTGWTECFLFTPDDIICDGGKTGGGLGIWKVCLLVVVL